MPSLHPDVSRIREDFLQLSQKINGKQPIYLDSACTTLRPEPVINAVADFQRRGSACHGRAYHHFGRAATDALEGARQTVANFIGARETQEVVFVRNATEGLNLAAFCLGLQEGDVVLTTDMEHNSNLLPWQRLARTGRIRHELLSLNPADGSLDLHALRARLAWHAGKVKLVSLFHLSNLTGVELPLGQIIRLAHEHGALVMVDAAQSVMSRQLRVQELGADLLVFSLHKMFGPSGVGVFWGRAEVLRSLEPFLLGGETIEDVTHEAYELAAPPARFEAGVANVDGAVGAAAAINYLTDIGAQEIHDHVVALNTLATEGLDPFSRVHLLGPQDPRLRNSILNFYVEGLESRALAGLLDRRQNIMVRHGKQCVHAWFNKYKLPESVRVSFAIYNTEQEVSRLVGTLSNVLAMLG